MVLANEGQDLVGAFPYLDPLHVTHNHMAMDQALLDQQLILEGPAFK